MIAPVPAPLPKVAAATRHVLLDIETFSRYVLKTPLYAYQLEPARAIMESIAGSRGDEILLIMSRQSGKNETVAQLLTYLLNLLHRAGGNIVYAVIGDNVGRGIRRLEEHLDNDWNANNWKRRDGQPLSHALPASASPRPSSPTISLNSSLNPSLTSGWLPTPIENSP